MKLVYLVVLFNFLYIFPSHAMNEEVSEDRSSSSAKSVFQIVNEYNDLTIDFLPKAFFLSTLKPDLINRNTWREDVKLNVGLKSGEVKNFTLADLPDPIRSVVITVYDTEYVRSPLAGYHDLETPLTGKRMRIFQAEILINRDSFKKALISGWDYVLEDIQ